MNAIASQRWTLQSKMIDDLNIHDGPAFSRQYSRIRVEGFSEDKKIEKWIWFYKNF